jgi:two-component system cell cycle response regulator
MDEKKQRLLIVDDSRVIRVTARKILRDHFVTVEAADGEEAWEVLTGDEPVSLVVSDLTMPNLDGFGLLEKIRNSHLPQVRDVPVIIITGANDTDATMEQARAAGATDFIGKPFDSVHLLARTQAHASSHHAANALRQENTALEDMSTVDQLTGLVNESSFMERGYQQLAYAIRHFNSLCIFRIEIDGFGELFQEYGQEFTVSVTQAIGEILLSSIRAEDTAARIGTARFALLLPGMEKSGVRKLAERINRELGRRTFRAGDMRLPVTISIGVSLPEIQSDTRFDEMLALADKRLSQAIAMGGNQVIHEDHETTPVLETVEIPEPVMETAAAEAEPTPEAFDPFSDGNMEVEEIELSAPTFAHDPFDIFAKETPQAQTSPLCRSATEPVSSTFAGPAAESPAVEPALDTASDAGTTTAGITAVKDAPGPTVPANDVGREDAVEPEAGSDAIGNMAAAPFSAHPVGEAANEARTITTWTPERADDELEKPEARRGILKWLMAGLRALFGRSRQHKSHK